MNKIKAFCTLNLLAPIIHTIYKNRERNLKAAEVIIGSANNEVVSFSCHLVTDKMKTLSPE